MKPTLIKRFLVELDALGRRPNENVRERPEATDSACKKSEKTYEMKLGARTVGITLWLLLLPATDGGPYVPGTGAIGEPNSDYPKITDQ